MGKEVLSYWYCGSCKEEIADNRVTNQELCDACGHPVEQIEHENIGLVKTLKATLKSEQECTANLEDEIVKMREDVEKVDKQLKAERERVKELEWEIERNMDGLNVIRVGCTIDSAARQNIETILRTFKKALKDQKEKQ